MMFLNKSYLLNKLGPADSAIAFRRSFDLTMELDQIFGVLQKSGLAPGTYLRILQAHL